jgi:Fic family protein
MPFDRNTPYNSLPKLPPNSDFQTLEIMNKVVTASRKLAGLNGALNLIPDPWILFNSISLQEARVSSEIENIVTTQAELYEASVSEASNTSPASKEVQNYHRALLDNGPEAFERGISVNTVTNIMRTIRGVDDDIRIDGAKIANPDTGEVFYTAPEGEELLKQLLANWENFLNVDNGIDPLIKLAINHYQFEAVHPFSDGNGRTGRIINIIYLSSTNLLRLPVLYLSKYLIENKKTYYRLIREVTEQGRWEEWILFMLDGIEQTATETRLRIEVIRKLMNSAEEKAKDRNLTCAKKEVIEIIFRHPFCKISNLIDAKIAKRDTASSYLKELAELGILERYKLGREYIYMNSGLIELLK